MTLNDAFSYCVKSLTALYDLREAENISFLLFEDKLGIPKATLRANGEETLSEVKANQLAYALVRLTKGEPVQYVLGHTEFFGLKLKVNKSVLIPRPETEELVEWIIEEEKNSGNLKILDIGTGSGCIAIAVQKNLPDAEVWALDNSGAVLKTAKENAELNSADIHFLHENILKDNLKTNILVFDLIVSNPPYVLSSEKKSMHQNVIAYEPHEALFVPDNDPLIFYKAIIQFSKKHLAGDGKIFFEINESLGEPVRQLLTDHNFTRIILKKDLSGKDRIIKAIR